MASEYDTAILHVTFFKAITFAPLIVVSLLVLLASWLAILGALAWLMSLFHEYRAVRGIDNALAQNMENGMAENRVVGNGSLMIASLENRATGG